MELKYKLGNEIITTKEDKDKAEVLAEFFRSVFTTEPNEGIPILNPRDITFKCDDIKIKEKEVFDLLLNVNPNKSPGPDGIHPKALKELAEVLAKPLTITFKTLIQTGIVMDFWKIGNIIALFKKGDKSDPGNYRPVSLTSVVGKRKRLSGK